MVALEHFTGARPIPDAIQEGRVTRLFLFLPVQVERKSTVLSSPVGADLRPAAQAVLNFPE